MSAPLPSATSNSGSPSAANSGDNSNILNYTALIVALVALVVSMLQLILQYVLSAEGRSKVGNAAIGVWANKNKFHWRPWRAKLYIKYLRPSIDIEQFLSAIRIQGAERQVNLNILINYKVTEQIPISETKDGATAKSQPQITLTRKGTEEVSPTLPHALRGRERQAAKSLFVVSRRLFSAPPPTKATWCSLMCDLGLDLERLPGTGELIDAETIPSALDAPPLQIRMSDLIHFGFLLEMTVVEANVLKRVLCMTGRHCSIESKHQDGAGMITRYTPMAYNTQPSIRRASEQEMQMMCGTADGMIYIGDCMMSLGSWDFTALDNIFKHVLRQCKGNAWQELPLKDYLRKVEGDSLVAWDNKWIEPHTPIVGLLMAMCGNVGVATAFPHDSIGGWAKQCVSRATSDAFKELERHPGFVLAPRDIFHRIWDSGNAGTDIMLMDELKTVNNYGCQFGGIRGWLSTNLAEFTRRMSQPSIWPCEQSSQKFGAVPILSQLYPVMKGGFLSKVWGEKYSYAQEEGNGWKLPATSLLWLQVCLLDTWLARNVDIMMGDTAMPELTVPAEIKHAEVCANAANETLNQSTGWNPPRLQFCRLYLNRLASGVRQKGASFMSTTDGFSDRREGWEKMLAGTTEQWVVTDAVLTLRAACQHTRFMMLRDSSALLRLRTFDPVLLLA